MHDLPEYKVSASIYVYLCICLCMTALRPLTATADPSLAADAGPFSLG